MNGTNLTMYQMGSDATGSNLFLQSDKIEMGNLTFTPEPPYEDSLLVNFNPALPFVYTNTESY